MHTADQLPLLLHYHIWLKRARARHRLVLSPPRILRVRTYTSCVIYGKLTQHLPQKLTQPPRDGPLRTDHERETAHVSRCMVQHGDRPTERVRDWVTARHHHANIGVDSRGGIHRAFRAIYSPVGAPPGWNALHGHASQNLQRLVNAIVLSSCHDLALSPFPVWDVDVLDGYPSELHT